MVPAADVIVIGGGLAGLTTALACTRRGLTVTLFDAARRGGASAASAGVLGPSIGRGPKGGRVGRFMFAARDRYPSFLADLHERSGVRVGTVAGAIEIALNETHFAELRSRSASLPDARVLDAASVAALEPALVAVAGAVHHPRDGAVDVAALLEALARAAGIDRRLSVLRAEVRSLDALATPLPNVTLGDGTRIDAGSVVLAAGAWTPAIHGLPRQLPVRPVKGEVATMGGRLAVRQVLFGAGGYLVPRNGSLLVGATSEEAGFDPAPSAGGATELAATVCALLGDVGNPVAGFAAHHAGLRPMTPDGYPVIGRDPDAPSLLYACGYSRNGVLVSPLAADCLAATIAGEDAGFDLTAFAVTRFGG